MVLFSEKQRLFVGLNVLEERLRKWANLVLSNPICLSVTVKDPVCYDTTMALNKLPDLHSPLRLCHPSFFCSSVHSSSLLFASFMIWTIRHVDKCISSEKINGLIIK